MHTIEHFLDGKTSDGTSERRGPVYDPATGMVRSEVLLADAEDVDEAVTVAKEAFPSWGAAPLSRRTTILFDFRTLLAQHQSEVASAITAEHGKTHADALGEVARGLENVEYACGLLSALKGEFLREVSTGVDVRSSRHPLGVVAGITPFNFPAMVPLWMVATAIACGNTFVLKPSEKDPSASMILAELLSEAGLPPGVFNVVHGDAATVGHILDHPDIEAVSFVGSTPVAESIYRRATASGKRVQALGGAKNHLVVMPDADVDLAADAAVSAGYGSAGERCMAISVVVAVGSVGDPLVDAIRARVARLRVGPGDDADTDMGPLISSEHRDRVAGYVAGAGEEGAQVVVDGRRASRSGNGFFLGPSLVDRVTTDMRLYRDEIFGPVLSIVRTDDLDGALAVVNGHHFGNGAAIFTRDGAAARRFESEAEVGMVGVNIPIPVPSAAFSFGGWKGSLFGDTHIYGPEGVHFYTRAKVVTSRWPEQALSHIDLGFSPHR